MRDILKDPLVHFLAAGLLLFVVFDMVGSEDASVDDTLITVDRTRLLTFLQYRMRAFEPELAARRFDEMDQTELDALIADYVREEAMVREALALGLDANDNIIRRRMAQKVEFVAQGFASASVAISEEELAATYADNFESYYIEPVLTFTHVFFDAERAGRDAALAQAAKKLAELNAESVPFSQATRHGDRFPYLVNYVERGPDFVASHMGPALTQQLMTLEPSDARWYGPFQSPYGVHLVMHTKRVDGRTPPLEEIVDRVRDDAARSQARARKDAAVDAIVAGYRVEIDLPERAEAPSDDPALARADKEPTG